MKIKKLIKKIERLRNFDDITWLPDFKYKDDLSDFEKSHLMDPNDCTLTINIKNPLNKGQEIIIFGAVKDPNNNYNDKSIQITCVQSSYESVKAYLLGNTIITRSFYFNPNSYNQLLHPIKFYEETITGATSMRNYPFGKFEDIIHGNKPRYKSMKGRKRIEDRTLRIDKNTYWQIFIEANTQIEITLIILAKIELGRTIIHNEKTF